MPDYDFKGRVSITPRKSPQGGGFVRGCLGPLMLGLLALGILLAAVGPEGAADGVGVALTIVGCIALAIGAISSNMK